MRVPSIQSNYQINNRLNHSKKTLEVASSTSSYNYSGFELGQTLKAQQGFAFRGLSTPIEVTHLYNKKTEGKDHLDLPNIHVYEFPDTNLRVFVNEIQNMTDRNKFQASLAIVNRGIHNDSIVKKNLLIELIKNSFIKHDIDVDVNEDFNAFINIDLNGDISEIKKISTLNKIITEPNFSEQDLEICKNKLLEKVNSEKYQQETQEFKELIDDSLLNSQKDTIQSIQNITLDDIYSYYSEILKNTEAQYVVTIDKDFVNNNKKLFYSTLSSDISNKFQKYSDEIHSSLPLKCNKKDIKIYDDNNETFLTFHYPVKIESDKDFLVCKYLTLLEIFWKTPYISEDSDCKKYLLPIELKSKDISPNQLGFLHFNFTPRGNEKIYSTNQAIDVFKALLETLYSEELSSNTLESIKDYEKELFDERLNKKFDYNNTHQILQNYKGNIFKIYETIDSVSIEDIKKAIETILFEQNPVVIINEKKNPYQNKNK